MASPLDGPQQNRGDLSRRGRRGPGEQTTPERMTDCRIYTSVTRFYKRLKRQEKWLGWLDKNLTQAGMKNLGIKTLKIKAVQQITNFLDVLMPLRYVTTC